MKRKKLEIRNKKDNNMKVKGLAKFILKKLGFIKNGKLFKVLF